MDLIFIALGVDFRYGAWERDDDLRGVNIHRLSGELVGHLANASGAEKRLDKATDELFSTD